MSCSSRATAVCTTQHCPGRAACSACMRRHAHKGSMRTMCRSATSTCCNATWHNRVYVPARTSDAPLQIALSSAKLHEASTERRHLMLEFRGAMQHRLMVEAQCTVSNVAHPPPSCYLGKSRLQDQIFDNGQSCNNQQFLCMMSSPFEGLRSVVIITNLKRVAWTQSNKSGTAACRFIVVHGP